MFVAAVPASSAGVAVSSKWYRCRVLESAVYGPMITALDETEGNERDTSRAGNVKHDSGRHFIVWDGFC
jgi:hypothetical protein